ncbi:hypothetical protein TWF970_010798 [Orbilia oligospora]|uniref:Uncharacterized protein n=1 Tax=Orbilia oligospora TaxID=2813651 RepID=A0A7C8R4T9_ORBOL|nr:hypothetical protein TWF970_010798 [Orbilia oligospora]
MLLPESQITPLFDDLRKSALTQTPVTSNPVSYRPPNGWDGDEIYLSECKTTVSLTPRQGFEHSQLTDLAEHPITTIYLTLEPCGFAAISNIGAWNVTRLYISVERLEKGLGTLNNIFAGFPHLEVCHWPDCGSIEIEEFGLERISLPSSLRVLELSNTDFTPTDSFEPHGIPTSLYQRVPIDKEAVILTLKKWGKQLEICVICVYLGQYIDDTYCKGDVSADGHDDPDGDGDESCEDVRGYSADYTVTFFSGDECPNFQEVLLLQCT